MVDLKGLHPALCVKAELSEQLADSDNDNNRVLALLKQTLKQGDQALVELFKRSVPAAQLVPARAAFIDQILTALWALLLKDNKRLALLAVGGYGRGELHPGSDVDLMVLGEEAQLQTEQETLKQFLTLLWDLGLEIGQSVRTLADCVREGKKDITVITNLTEARLLSGSSDLFDQLRDCISPQRIWPNHDFFAAKKEEQKGRYRKYHETAYNLEPNVKEGSGGLRDLQTIAWVAKRYFAAHTWHDLVEHGFLTEGEYKELLDCQGFLWQVRFALHVLNGRREDRLLFDYQRRLATEFGYQDEDANLAVEQFMQRYYRTLMSVSRLNEMLLQLFEEAILLAADSAGPVPIDRRFQARKGFLEVRNERVFKRYPFALLELFLVLQQHPELNGVRATTVRLVRDHCHLINDNFRQDVRARSLFMEILRQPERVTRAFRRMNRYGVLGAYLPEFARIIGRMQYDLFHVYTVDQHTLFLIRNLRRFDLPRFHDEFPHCSEVMQRIPKIELLYIAALYHDIAKGREGDHSELGAVDAAEFCHRHGLSSFDTKLIVWLVEHHLAMSLTAQKKDIHDPDVVGEFAHFVADQLHLDHLYLLTVADIRATNPTLWNSWRGALLRELYLATRRALRRGLDNPIDKDERIQALQQQALQRLLRARIDVERITRVWASFSDDYFLRYSVDEIVWHTRAILKKADDDRALVLAHEDVGRGGTEIFIYKRDSGGIFATTTAALDRLGLTILDARIITSNNGYTLDSFTVLEQTGEPIGDRRRRKEIIDSLRRQLNKTIDQVQLTSSRQPHRVLKHFNTPTEINFLQDNSNQRTMLEIITADRPGLLSRLGRAFMQCGIQLHNARIATIGERAEDIFYITKNDNKTLLNGESQSALKAAILHHLEWPQAA